MSDEKKKNLRTQGRFSTEFKEKPASAEGKDKKSGTKSYAKERKQRNSPQSHGDFNDDSSMSKKSPEQKQRNMETDILIKYEENSSYTNSFSQLKPQKKPLEIKKPGITVISETDNGESRIFFKPDFLSPVQAYEFYDMLLNSTEWCEKNLIIRGNEVPQPRLVAWYGPLPYEYSGITLHAREMTPLILKIKAEVERVLEEADLKVELNSVLLNRYRNGADSVAWHSDDELSMGVCPTIASVSLGETRKFELRRRQTTCMNAAERDPKDGIEFFVHLKNGSLVVMDGVMQQDWQHRVPKEYHEKRDRINLTFRTVYAVNGVKPELPQVKYLEDSSNIIDNTLTGDIKEECWDDESFPPLNGTTTSADPFAEVLNSIDISKSITKEEENISSPNEMNNLSKCEVPVPDHKEIEENLYCDASEVAMNSEFVYSPLPTVIPEPSYSNANWAQASINAPVFTSHNFGLQQLQNSMLYNSPLCSQQPEIQMLNNSVDQFMPLGYNLEDYNQHNSKFALNGHYSNLETEHLSQEDCSHIAKHICTYPDQDPEKCMEYLNAFKDIPYQSYKNLHLSRRDCEELRVLCLIAQEALALSDMCKLTILQRICCIIDKANYFWIKNQDDRNYDKRNRKPYMGWNT